MTITDPTAISTPPGRTGRLVRRPDRARGGPRWWAPAQLLLLGGTSVLYLGGLSASGWANAFYSAAAQAGSVSWRAWFFGASDAGASIMIDKPPASVWVMGLSARLFGLSSWSVLVPQALMGVAAVALLSAAVRRWSGPVAGLVAGAAFALTPVATLMFRFDNPDALLALLLVAGAYAMVRSVDASCTRRSTWWLVLAAACVGTGFLTKSLQAYLVLPAFVALHLVAGPGSVRRRWMVLLPSGLALLVASGWWVAVVTLWPAGSRPYVGGSQTNSALELAFGYNGVGRLTGDETGSLSPGGGGGPAGAGPGGVGGPAGGGFGAGPPGMGGGHGGSISTDSITALFDGSMASQVSWLLPAALVAGVALVWLAGRGVRSDRRRAAAVLWGGSLLVTGGVFSLAAGIIHPYYAVALAPWIAALVATGGVELWRHRRGVGRGGLGVRVVIAAMVALTAAWSWCLLDQASEFLPWLRATVLVVGLATAVVLLFWSTRWSRTVVSAVAVAVLVVGLAGPTAYAIDTAATPHTEIIPTAGPGRGGGAGGPGGPGGPGGSAVGGRPHARGGVGAGGGPRGPGGGAMTLLRASTPSTDLTALLRAGAPGHTWVAATVGSMPAAGYQLASGGAVMPLGGFNGTDPSPTLAQFQTLVAQHRIHYFVGDGLISSPDTGGSDAAVQITTWVRTHFHPTSIGGTTVYDLTAPVPPGS